MKPTTEFRHRPLAEIISYLSHELPTLESQEVEAHLQVCSSCAEVLDVVADETWR